MRKILILASNPRGDLNLHREIRDLKAAIERSTYRDHLQVDSEFAVRPSDLRRLLFQSQPQIVHFCGHGSGEQGLVFESDTGEEHHVQTEALSDLLRLFVSRGVECVLLNACYSEIQAEAIVQHVNYVVGMKQAISDTAAIAFATGFYEALGYNASIEESFEFGRNAIRLEISGSSRTRSTISEERRKLEIANAIQNIKIPEYLNPILKKKHTLTSDQASSTTNFSRTSFAPGQVEMLKVDKALEKETNLREYRKLVREYLADPKVRALLINGELNEVDKNRLKKTGEILKLSNREIDQVLKEEVLSIRQIQDIYKQKLIDYVHRYGYPFQRSGTIYRELKQFRNSYSITDEENKKISKPIFERAKRNQRLTSNQEISSRKRSHQDNLDWYKQEFIKASKVYPIDGYVRDGLRKFQLDLGLSNEEVSKIEKPILEQLELEREKQKKEHFGKHSGKQSSKSNGVKNQGQSNETAQNRTSHKLRFGSFEFQKATVEMIKSGLFWKTQIIPKVSSDRAKAEYFLEDLDGSQSLTMVSIPAGKFWMGLLSGDEGQSNWESPSHLVEIHPFFMSRYPVTQAQWKAVAAFRKVKLDLNPDPSHFKGGDRPVESVSWDEAVEFCNRLARKTGRNYRLPSEAEWEYACRAGTRTPFHFGEAITPDLVNFEELNRQGTTPVGHFGIANNFGLSDMHGNVWEWCADCWHENYEGAPRDGSAWSTGGDVNCRILRGGAWCHPSKRCRSAYRFKSNPQEKTDTYGLRVVCADL